MNIQHSATARGGISLGAVSLGALALGALTAVAPASAAPSQDLLFWPGNGKDVTPISVVTPGPCPASTKAVYAVAFGHGFGETGQVVIPTTPVGFSVTGRFAMPMQSTFNFYAQENATVLRGAYRVELICADATASTEYARFRGEMRFGDPHSFKASEYVPPSEPAAKTGADDAPGANRVPAAEASAAAGSQNQAGQGSASQNTASQSTASQNTASQNQPAQNLAAQPKPAQSSAAQNSAPQNSAAQNSAPQNHTAQNSAPQNSAGQPQAGQPQIIPAAESSNHLLQWGFALAGLILIGVAVRGLRRSRS